MSKPKHELKVGDIWGVLPLEKTLDVRIIHKLRRVSLTFWDLRLKVVFINIGGSESFFYASDFYDWIEQEGAVLIGHYDFETGKAVKK